ncbi:phospholipase A and acyltransferase 2 [Patella vulgata]|uniref:phospholipase A and acyltransferase 2 n=1 Tax=Patella vulgata TaxID=6465 RepID=UPI0024A7E235|nr:phospholipase A and acyltransferase 2 [Patella vulgata]
MQRTSNATVLGNLEEGDIVEFDRGLYSHYGVYVGDEEIVHVAGDGSNAGSPTDWSSGSLSSGSGIQSNKATVKRDKFWTVAGNSKAKISNKDDKRSPLPKHQIVKIALSKLGRRGYNLFWSNCEHFANWCRYEVQTSEQVCNAFSSMGQVVLIGVVVAIVAIAAVCLISWLW